MWAKLYFFMTLTDKPEDEESDEVSESSEEDSC